jgi:uncharacterized protein YuzE
MNEPKYTYDEDADILYISFVAGETATGIMLNDQLLLRVKRAERRAIGLTIMDYSILAHQTDIGPRAVPLTGLQEVSQELRELALDVLRTPMLQTIVTLSAYSPSGVETTPTVTLQPVLASAQVR